MCDLQKRSSSSFFILWVEICIAAHKFFRQVWGNSVKNASHPQAFACPYTYVWSLHINTFNAYVSNKSCLNNGLVETISNEAFDPFSSLSNCFSASSICTDAVSTWNNTLCQMTEHKMKSYEVFQDTMCFWCTCSINWCTCSINALDCRSPEPRKVKWKLWSTYSKDLNYTFQVKP